VPVASDVAGLEPEIVDLGDCDWNTTVPFEARFVNPGRERVVIAAVKTSCGCTGVDPASYAGMSVEAGDSLVIKGNMEVGAKPGGQRQQIDVLLDSGIVHSAYLSANVVAGYHLSAQDVDFGDIDLYEGAAVEPRIVLFRSEARQLLSVRASVPWLEVGTFDRADSAVELVLKPVVADLQFGPQAGAVEIETDDPYLPVSKFRVKAAGTSALRPFPSRITLAPGCTARVRFAQRDGSSARLANVESDEGLVCEVVDDGQALEVTAETGLTKGGIIRVRDSMGQSAKVIVAWTSQ